MAWTSIDQRTGAEQTQDREIMRGSPFVHYVHWIYAAFQALQKVQQRT